MRILTLVLLLAVSPLYAQEYVSGAIIAYHGAAYTRCLEDLNKALQTSAQLDVETRAKAYYYRGMARFQLLPEVPSTEQIMLVYADLDKAINLDTQWKIRSKEPLHQLTVWLKSAALAEYNRALQAEMNLSRPLLSVASDKLVLCLEIENSAATHLLLAKVYHAHGDVYYNMAEVGNPMEVQRQLMAHYSNAIPHYEEALRIGGGTMELYQSLQLLSRRIGDRERAERYGYLAAELQGQ